MRGGIAVRAAGVSEFARLRAGSAAPVVLCWWGLVLEERMRNETTSLQTFVQRRLPWVVAAVMLAVYFATLSRWITVSGAPNYSRVLGWDWQPILFAPLYHVLT